MQELTNDNYSDIKFKKIYDIGPIFYIEYNDIELINNKKKNQQLDADAPFAGDAPLSFQYAEFVSEANVTVCDPSGQGESILGELMSYEGKQHFQSSGFGHTCRGISEYFD